MTAGPEDDRSSSLTIGVGAAIAASAAEVGGLIDETLAGAALAPASVRCLATVEGRSGHAGIRAVAMDRGWDVIAYPVGVLAQVKVPNPSAAVRARTGVPSVAEAGALHAARTLGRHAELIVEKRRSARATVAVARFAPGAGPDAAGSPAPPSRATPGGPHRDASATVSIEEAQ
ncbi:cobalamin biosynthesis protein [Actinomadura xylanilytica]|uniref:cobalamin biosynthesis protein n=1 Tax=Actinomadura xylanilytica TaxID=887459 RepID=UPI00255AE7DF|nr:cobalamin biosynthesis protein [Actinomadura xylanilytica]MDL4777503.1 cobalamin biosynthesis protein [Actinomadura xylanilytica]